MNSDRGNSAVVHLKYEIKTGFVCIGRVAQWLNVQKAQGWQIECLKDTKGTQARAIATT